MPWRSPPSKETLPRGQPPLPAWLYSDLYYLLCWCKSEWTWEDTWSPGRRTGYWQCCCHQYSPFPATTHAPPHSAVSPPHSIHLLPSLDLPVWVQWWSSYASTICSSTPKMTASSVLCKPPEAFLWELAQSRIELGSKVNFRQNQNYVVTEDFKVNSETGSPTASSEILPGAV